MSFRASAHTGAPQGGFSCPSDNSPSGNPYPLRTKGLRVPLIRKRPFGPCRSTSDMENGLPHQPAGWFAMTLFFRYLASNETAPSFVSLSFSAAPGLSETPVSFFPSFSAFSVPWLGSPFWVSQLALVPASREEYSADSGGNP